MIELRRRLVSRANGYFYGHGEDAASEVILQAYVILKRQFIGEHEVGMPWRHEEDPMIAWLLALLGNRTTGKLSNYIRRELKHRPPLACSIHAEDFAEADISAVNGEEALVLRETIEQTPHNSAVPPILYLKAVRTQLESALKMFPDRDVFLFRIRTGIHSFTDLDAAALVSLAKEAGAQAPVRRNIRRIARELGIAGGNTVEPDTAGRLVGLSGRQVRNVVQRVAKLLEQTIGQSSA